MHHFISGWLAGAIWTSRFFLLGIQEELPATTRALAARLLGTFLLPKVTHTNLCPIPRCGRAWSTSWGLTTRPLSGAYVTGSPTLCILPDGLGIHTCLRSETLLGPMSQCFFAGTRTCSMAVTRASSLP